VFFNDVKIPGLSEIYVGVIKNIQIYSAQHMESKHCQDDIYIENHPLDGWNGMKPMIYLSIQTLP
jgi:hypothetical protein